MSTITPAQQAANQANAQLSTGPRTEAGKARASQNSRKHGLAASHLVIAESEREAFESMRDALAEEVAPQGELELTLFDSLLHANWNIRRCRILEAALMDESSGGVDPLSLDQNEAKLRQYDRHARRHDTNFHRALKELKSLQTEREFRTPALAQTAAPNEPAPAAAAAEEDQPPPPPPPSPLASIRVARQAFLREHTAKARVNAASFNLAMKQLVNGPPTAPISYFTFDQ